MVARAPSCPRRFNPSPGDEPTPRLPRREADEDQEKGGSGKRIRQSSLLFLPADITPFLPLLPPQEHIVCPSFPIPDLFPSRHRQTFPWKPEAGPGRLVVGVDALA